ncbi:MAG: hypothetical protein M1840_008129 [Geoglossum simile]|nr:MAG: hypothetical protein M1840_008129 [Geoglossum simile]
MFQLLAGANGFLIDSTDYLVGAIRYGSSHMQAPHGMDLARQVVVDSAYGEAHEVITRLVEQNARSPAEALKIVAAAWAYIETHELWDGTYDSIYELQQVMNFQQMIEPMLQRAKGYDGQRVSLMKAITRRWRTAATEAIPVELRPKTVGRGLLTALRGLSDRVPDRKEAVRLIQRQVVYRVGENQRRVHVVKNSDTQAIMDDFHCTGLEAVEEPEVDSAEKEAEISSDDLPQQSEQSEQSEQLERPEQQHKGLEDDEDEGEETGGMSQEHTSLTRIAEATASHA